MTQRSQQNPRYRKDANIGSTRKSASSLRTKRAGSSSSGSAKKKSPSRGGRPRPRFQRPGYMDNPEWRTYSRYNWVAIGIAMVAALVLILPQYVEQFAFLKENRLFFSIVSGAWLAGLGTSVYIQFVVLKRIRKDYESRGKTAGKAAGKSEEKRPDKGGKDS